VYPPQWFSVGSTLANTPHTQVHGFPRLPGPAAGGKIIRRYLAGARFKKVSGAKAHRASFSAELQGVPCVGGLVPTYNTMSETQKHRQRRRILELAPRNARCVLVHRKGSGWGHTIVPRREVAVM